MKTRDLTVLSVLSVVYGAQMFILHYDVPVIDLTLGAAVPVLGWKKIAALRLFLHFVTRMIGFSGCVSLFYVGGWPLVTLEFSASLMLHFVFIWFGFRTLGKRLLR